MSGDGVVETRSEAIRRDNRVLLMKLGVVVVAMFGFGYALVPFYEKICEVTGLRDIDKADTVVNTQVVCEVVNTSDQPVTGQAIPSYGPRNAAQYFRKLDCFCFTRQTLAPGETRRMPVVFVVDPAMPKDLSTITLSYTFFKVEGNAKT